MSDNETQEVRRPESMNEAPSAAQTARARDLATEINKLVATAADDRVVQMMAYEMSIAAFMFCMIRKDGWKTFLVTLANNIKRPLFKAGKRGYTKKIEYIKGGPKK